MSYRRARQPLLRLWHAVLLAALPSACATSIQQDFEDDGAPSSAGSGGALATGGSGNVVSPMPKAGSTGNGGSASNPFGGSSSTGGMATGGAGGMSGSDGGTDNEGGTGGMAMGGTGGSSAGGASAGTGGGNSGACGCAKTLTWVDDTNISFTTGDCLKVGDATYKYVGVRMQTWAHSDCNPTEQLSWCSDVGADYKFTVCP